MEGISDGRAIDDCYYCAFVYPYIETCPLCGGRMRYMAASMMSDVELAESLRQHLDAYRRASRYGSDRATARSSLVALLEFIHRYRDAASAQLAELDGPSMDELCAAFRALS